MQVVGSISLNPSQIDDVTAFLEGLAEPLGDAPFATIRGTVTLQGRTTATAGGEGHGIATVTLNPGRVIVNVRADGTFEIPNVSHGTYTLTASARGYVPAQFTNLVATGILVSLTPVELGAGLANTDSVVNINDITAIVAAFDTTPPARFDTQGRFVDANDDGIVNINDITAVVSNFGTTSPRPWK